MLRANAAEARQADSRSSVINETGKYIGKITRAEQLTSEKGTTGLGLSFKDVNGATANYLDLYTYNAKGEALPSNQIVNALLVCLRTKEVPDGQIDVEKRDKNAGVSVKKTVPGYPTLMNKDIGLLLQKELSINDRTGDTVERMVIYGVFEAGTEFTASEILDKAVKPEKLEKMVSYLASHPVNDRRKNKSAPAQSQGNKPSGGGFDDDDLDF